MHNDSLTHCPGADERIGRGGRVACFSLPRTRALLCLVPTLGKQTDDVYIRFYYLFPRRDPTVNGMLWLSILEMLIKYE